MSLSSSVVRTMSNMPCIPSIGFRIQQMLAEKREIPLSF